MYMLPINDFKEPLSDIKQSKKSRYAAEIIILNVQKKTPRKPIIRPVVSRLKQNINFSNFIFNPLVTLNY